MYARTQEILPMRLRLFFLALLALAGCAHEQAKVESTPPPVAVATPTPAPPPAAPAAESSADLQEFLSQPVAHFAFDRADLTPEDQLRLQVLAGLLRAQAGARIQLGSSRRRSMTERFSLPATE